MSLSERTPAADATTTPFSYRALRSDGSAERGVLRVADRSAAIAMLAARGLFPMDVAVQREARSFFVPRVSAGDLAVGLRILATLLDAGLPIRRAAAAFATLAPASWSPIVEALAPALRDGRSLSAALTESSVSFPPVIIGIIRAGEAGGTVPSALRSAADLAESTAALRSAIRGALVYPAVLALTGGVSVVILVSIVLPRFATILKELGQALPPTTRLVLDAASVAHRAAPAAAIVLIVTMILLRSWLTTEAGRMSLHSSLLRVPVIGKLRHSVATSRGCASLAALLESGVSMPQALVHSARAVGDAAVAASVMRAREAVIGGRALGSALEELAAFTPASLRLVRAGEETGRLSAMLAHAARLERDRATDGVRRLVRLIEPTLILVFAGLVALVAAALLQAVYSVRPA